MRDASARALATLLLLSGFAGLTIGMLNVLGQLFAIRLGAGSMELGLISASQSVTIAAFTLPAGIAVARYGARRVYMVASLIVMLIYLAAPWSTSWWGLLVAGALGNCCIPFRIVAINGTFMARLKEFGTAKAGWYRGSQVAGFILLGPLLGTVVLERFGVFAGYWTVAAMFAFMAMAGLAVLPARRRDAAAQTLSASIRQLWSIVTAPDLRAVLEIELYSSSVNAVFGAFIVLIGVQQLHLAEPAAVSVRFFEAVVAVVTLFFGGPLLGHLPNRSLHRASAVLVVAGLGLLSLADGYWLMAAATLVLGTGLGLVGIVNSRQLALFSHDKSTSTSLQLLSSFSGGVVGGIVGGSVGHAIGLRPLFLVAAVAYGLLSTRWCLGRATAIRQPAE